MLKLTMCSLAKLSLILFFFIKPVTVFASEPILTEVFPVQSMQLKNRTYQLEIADTVKRKKQGLMFRNSLQQNAGMLFKYSIPGNYRIWMKNTLIPLTVIWLDEQAIIIDKKVLQPCRSINCPVFGVSRPSRFILELNPSEYNHFNIGDSLPAILFR